MSYALVLALSHKYRSASDEWLVSGKAARPAGEGGAGGAARVAGLASSLVGCAARRMCRCPCRRNNVPRAFLHPLLRRDMLCTACWTPKSTPRCRPPSRASWTRALRLPRAEVACKWCLPPGEWRGEPLRRWHQPQGAFTACQWTPAHWRMSQTPVVVFSNSALTAQWSPRCYLHHDVPALLLLPRRNSHLPWSPFVHARIHPVTCSPLQL